MVLNKVDLKLKVKLPQSNHPNVIVSPHSPGMSNQSHKSSGLVVENPDKLQMQKKRKFIMQKQPNYLRNSKNVGSEISNVNLESDPKIKDYNDEQQYATIMIPQQQLDNISNETKIKKL